MKRTRSLIVCVLLFVAIPTISVMPGCDIFGQHVEDTPRGNYFETQEVYIAAVTIALDSKRSGSISQDDWNTIYNPAIQQGNTILDSMEAALISSDSSRMETLRSLLIGVIEIINGGQS